MPRVEVETVLKSIRLENDVLSAAKTTHVQTCNPDMLISNATRCAVYVTTMLPRMCGGRSLHCCRTSMCSSCCKDVKSSSGDTCQAAPPKNFHCAVHLS